MQSNWGNGRGGKIAVTTTAADVAAVMGTAVAGAVLAVVQLPWAWRCLATLLSGRNLSQCCGGFFDH